MFLSLLHFKTLCYFFFLLSFQGMKSIRVKLMRQMKEESERFRALKAQKEKEINQLKQQVRPNVTGISRIFGPNYPGN